MNNRLVNFRFYFLFSILSLLLLFSCQKDEVTPSAVPVVDLSVTSVVDNTAPVIDGFVTYTISAKNTGSNNANEVVVVDSLPAGLKIDNYTAAKGRYDVRTGRWLIGDLGQGAESVLTIKAKVVSFGSIINRVRITGKVTDNNAKNDSSKTIVSTSLASLSKEQTCSYDVFSAMKDIYLWNDALPSVFDPRKYSTAENGLEYLSGLKINSVTGQVIDRYSFLDKIGNLSGEINGGTASGDYGFMVKAASSYNEPNKVSFFVSYVYSQSPAGLAGVERGFEILKINGSDAVHPDVDAQGYLVPSSAGYVNMVNALFNSATASFTFKKKYYAATTLDASLSVASYAINSVLFDTIYTVGSKKVGYMVFNQFLGESSQTEIANSISRYETSGVQYLIVDLRYNGGGSVETCEKFCNLLAPQSANGKLMYSYKMNSELMDYYVSNKYNLTTTFAKTNSFQPTRIYFIVSGGTASASELLINNLRPYYTGNLFLIGQTTYGKPCGFWSTPIGYTDTQTITKEGYDLYAVSFEMANANNEGGYYSGMTPATDKYPGIKAYDSFALSWGDQYELSLAQALNHISTGAFKEYAQSKVKSVSVLPVSNFDRQFKGMIDFRKRLKLKIGK